MDRAENLHRRFKVGLAQVRRSLATNLGRTERECRWIGREKGTPVRLKDTPDVSPHRVPWCKDSLDDCEALIGIGVKAEVVLGLQDLLVCQTVATNEHDLPIVLRPRLPTLLQEVHNGILELGSYSLVLATCSERVDPRRLDLKWEPLGPCAVTQRHILLVLMKGGDMVNQGAQESEHAHNLPMALINEAEQLPNGQSAPSILRDTTSLVRQVKSRRGAVGEFDVRRCHADVEGVHAPETGIALEEMVLHIVGEYHLNGIWIGTVRLNRLGFLLCKPVERAVDSPICRHRANTRVIGVEVVRC